MASWIPALNLLSALLLHLLLMSKLLTAVGGRGAGECAMLCNDLRFEVLTLEICREAKRTLPRPKVGDFCSTAMEQGFSDGCVALCMEQRPVARVAQACRAAAIEMPRPTVRRWCEHGYNVAFQKSLNDLSTHFHVPAAQSSSNNVESKVENAPTHGGLQGEGLPSVYDEKHRGAEAKQDPVTAQRAVVASVSVTLENDEEQTLYVYEGQDAEEAVVDFCRNHVPTEMATCIRSLLDRVVEKMQEVQGERDQ